MGRKTINFLEDEEISNCVKKYPCLYDKGDQYYKDKRAKKYFHIAVKIETIDMIDNFSHVFLFLRFCFLIKRTARSIKSSSSSLSIFSKVLTENVWHYHILCSYYFNGHAIAIAL